MISPTLRLNYLMAFMQCRINKMLFVHYKNHETLLASLAIQIYINRINNRSVFKSKDGHRLEIPTLEMKLVGSKDKIIDKRKN